MALCWANDATARPELLVPGAFHRGGDTKAATTMRSKLNIPASPMSRVDIVEDFPCGTLTLVGEAVDGSMASTFVCAVTA